MVADTPAVGLAFCKLHVWLWLQWLAPWPRHDLSVAWPVSGPHSLPRPLVLLELEVGRPAKNSLEEVLPLL